MHFNSIPSCYQHSIIIFIKICLSWSFEDDNGRNIDPSPGPDHQQHFTGIFLHEYNWPKNWPDHLGKRQKKLHQSGQIFLQTGQEDGGPESRLQSICIVMLEWCDHWLSLVNWFWHGVTLTDSVVCEFCECSSKLLINALSYVQVTKSR